MSEARRLQQRLASIEALTLFALLALGCDLSSEANGSAAIDGPELVSDETNAPEFALTEAGTTDLDALRALGYIHEVGGPQEELAVGVLLSESGRIREGLDFITVAGDCSAHIARPDGEVLREWSHRPCTRWENGFLTPAGELYVVHNDPIPPGASPNHIIYRSNALLKFDWDGKLLWKRGMPVHHDVGPTPDGNVAVLIRRFQVYPSLHKRIPIQDHGIAIVSPEGRLLEHAWIADMMARSAEVYTPIVVPPPESHPNTPQAQLHANSIHWMNSDELAREEAFYSKENVLVTLRAQNAILLINWPTKKIIWAWGHGELRGPHDANVLSNGNILVFDNRSARDGSRIVEVDPLENEIVWEYRGHDFYSASRGGAQRLGNGNTLVAVSDRATAFEVTSEGELVWQYRNPIMGREGMPAVIVRVRSYTPGATLRPTSFFD